MFDIGWTEMLVIVLVAVLVIGPKDIPKIMYQVGRFFRRLQYMRFAMSQQFDEILKAGDIDELRRGVNFEAPKTDEKAADEEEAEISPLLSPRTRGEDDGEGLSPDDVTQSPPARGGDKGGAS